MKKTYALKRLLEHGAMDTREIIDCTRWTRRQVNSALDELQRHNLVRAYRKNGGGIGYSYMTVTV